MLCRGQLNGGGFIVLENRPTRSLVPKLPQCSLVAVCEFSVANKERCEWGYQQVCVKLCCQCLSAWSASEFITAKYMSVWVGLLISQELRLAWWTITQKASKTTELSKLVGGHLRGTIHVGSWWGLAGTGWNIHTVHQVTWYTLYYVLRTDCKLDHFVNKVPVYIDWSDVGVYIGSRERLSLVLFPYSWYI